MYTIGIDIGGTKIKFGMLDEKKQLVQIDEIKTPKEEVLETIIGSIKSIIGENELKGIGIATAGIVDVEKGKVTSAANIPAFVNIPLVQKLEETFHVPVAIANDANSAALAEGKVGAAVGADSYICVAIGTGIGGGIIHNGELVHGRNGYGGEIGHMIIEPDGRQCGCGRKGCWEAYASGSALERMIQEDPVLAKETYHPRDLFENYTKNESCREIVDAFIEYLSIGISNLQYLFDPEMIVIGGGVIASGEHWWDKLVEKAANKSSIPLNLQQAQLKNDASMIGASFLVPER
ncbi:hypothetical protein CIL05_00890 [Virgibacillus profundi]|uniref:Sugar kinase n=1 Tax=Virgibacillus profundi TaxID=2024555 RepID=A0A2A2IJF8_9BACI|nr:ROK family protein [Virgibacillus profundi]PAV31243.1 hypothetical protein CIL05_00890 [Virgibacillus profundi]PXY55428.1 ROK family protein [Virgibacillus profundi]